MWQVFLESLLATTVTKLVVLGVKAKPGKPPPALAEALEDTFHHILDVSIDRTRASREELAGASKQAATERRGGH